MEVAVSIEQQEVVQKQTLTTGEIAAIKELVATCEQAENVHMRIDWAMLRSRSGSATNDFLYYVNAQLVGYLALDDRGGAENEIVGMVHPAFRRQGIFTALINAAFAECRTRGLRHMILICERSSASGQAFLRSFGSTYSESEHEMWLTEEPVLKAGDERLIVRPARLNEVDALAQVQAESFEQDDERARWRVEERMEDAERSTYYIGVLGNADVGCEEPVGSLRVDLMEGVVGIYAFGVRPVYQGRGYGRQILTEIVHLLRQKGHQHILLDVNTENTRAINLYTSCGFRIRSTYDYYIIAA